MRTSSRVMGTMIAMLASPALAASPTFVADALAAPAGPAPPVATAHEAMCAALDRENEDAYARGTPNGIRPEELALPDFLGWCAPVADGVWGAVLKELHGHASAPGSSEPVYARWTFVHLDDDGSRAEIMPNLLRDGIQPAAVRHENANVAPGIGDLEEHAPVVFDFDGDGHPEIAVTVSYVYPTPATGIRSTWSAVLSASHGKIEMYKKTVPARFRSVADVDGDGRPDLVVQRQIEIPASKGCSDECWSDRDDGRPEVWRSRPDGSFARAPKLDRNVSSGDAPRRHLQP